MISIVIPALNEERFLPDCLKSLRDQDYKGQYEIIIADNGSSDNTASIARSLGARVISCPEKRSVFYARQIGAEAARGDIIAQADADTIYPRDWLTRIANQLASCPDTAAITGRFNYRDQPSWARIEYFFRHYINKISNIVLGRPLVICGASLAFRRRAFLTVDGYKGLPYSADQYGIAGRLSKLGRVLYDGNLCVLTSSRSVQKPFLLILVDLLANLARWAIYSCQCGMSTLREFAVRRRSRSIAARLLPVSTVLIMFLIGYGYFVPTSPVFGKVYSQGSLPEKVVALTFDDGPNEPYTSQILDTLATHNVKATFFVIGKNMELYPKTARRIVTEGHVLGNHSYSHDANHALSDYGAEDLERAQVAIYDTLGIRPHLYRPPHGKKSPWELHAVRKAGMIEVMWSVSANELHDRLVFGKPSPETITKEIVSDVRPGKIILLHDGYGTNHNDVKSDKTLTVKALPLIIEALKAKGYRFVTVPELLNVPAYNE